MIYERVVFVNQFPQKFFYDLKRGKSRKFGLFYQLGGWGKLLKLKGRKALGRACRSQAANKLKKANSGGVYLGIGSARPQCADFSKGIEVHWGRKLSHKKPWIFVK